MSEGTSLLEKCRTTSSEMRGYTVMSKLVSNECKPLCPNSRPIGFSPLIEDAIQYHIRLGTTVALGGKIHLYIRS